MERLLNQENTNNLSKHEKNKRILIIAYKDLDEQGTAGQTVMRGMVRAALEDNFIVSYLGLHEKGDADRDEIELKNTSQNLECDKCYYKIKKRTKLRMIGQAFNHASLFELVSDSYMLHQKYNGILSFESFPYSIARNVSAKKHITIIGDPAGDRLKYSFNLYKFISVKGFIKTLLLPRVTGMYERWFWKSQVKKVDGVAMFGTSHAREWSKILSCKVIDIRPMIPKVEGLLFNSQKKLKTIIAYGGTLDSTATQLGAGSLRNDLRASLDKVFVSNYEFQIIGRGNVDWVNRLNNWPQVKFIGEVVSFEIALQQVDIFLLPMKYPVGVRTRICSAIQSGCYCIADESILHNMPELKGQPFIDFISDENTYEMSIRKYQKIINLNRLRKKAIEFFNSHYLYTVASTPILKEFK
jgi:hypothetical protein